MEQKIPKTKNLCASYLRNKKSLPNLLLHFQNLHQILNIKKKMALITHVFPKLETAKDPLS